MERSIDDETRRRNWLAISFATPLMAFCNLAYAAAFVSPEGEPDRVDGSLVALGLAFAPLVFVIVAFVSHNASGPRRVLFAMLLLVLVGLAAGLLAPALGAAAGFAAGGAITLQQPEVSGVMTWRLAAVALTTVYTFVLLVIVTPAGVFAGALLPLIMLGFADEYASWYQRRERAPSSR